MHSFIKALPLFLVLGGSTLASPISVSNENKRDDLLCIAGDLHISDPFFTLHELKNGRIQQPDTLTLDAYVSILSDCCDNYEKEHPGYCEQHGWCGDGPGNRGGDCGEGRCGDGPGHRGGDCGEGGCRGGKEWGWENGVCLIAELNIVDPFFTRNEFLNGRLQHPQSVDVRLFGSLLDTCCDGYEHDHPGYCEQHGWCGHNGVLSGLGGWNNGVCIIANTHIDDPIFTRNEIRNGRMESPSGIDAHLFLSLLDGCCDGYQQEHGDGLGRLVNDILH